MKLTVIGSHLCPDTLYALNQLSGACPARALRLILKISFPATGHCRITCRSARAALSMRRFAAPGVWESPVL